MIQDYINAGLALVPITAGKSPGFKGWEQRGSALRVVNGQVVSWSGHPLHPSWGVGLMHAHSGTMAFDIDDWAETKKYGIDVDALYAAPDAVTVLSGRQGRGKLLYRMPLGMTLPTKKHVIRVPVEGHPGKTRSHTVFEMRCGTEDGTTVQDVLPPSIHPDTGLPYQWGGAGHWSRIPTIPVELLTIWHSLISAYTPPTTKEVANSSWDEVKSALAFISPDCNRDDWRNVGMALRWRADKNTDDQAFTIWDEWSAGATIPNHYPGTNELRKQWASFKSNKKNPITLSTLFYLAHQGGWTPPVPDVSAMFKDVAPAQPADITSVFKPQPPEVDLSLWPPVLAKRAQEVGDGVGCDPSIPLWAGLAAVCGAIDARTRLELNPTFFVPPVLWLMTVGDPAAKKTPGSKMMFKPLGGIEMDEKPRFAQEMMEWKAKQVMYSRDFNIWEKFMHSEQGMMDPGTGPQQPPEIPAAPEPVKITVMDITSQALAVSAAARPRGLLCVLDEMNGWIEKVTSRSSGENRSTWVSAYESERYELERVGNGRKTVDNLAVSIYGNVQPQVLRDNFNALSSDGMLQRFLPLIVRADKDKRGKPLPDFLTTVAQWETLLRRVYGLSPTVYRLSNESRKVYEDFQDWYQENKTNERLVNASNAFLQAYGKLEGLAGRLILMFHVIENPYNQTVSADLVERVIRLVRTFIIPTYRYLLDDDGNMSTFDLWLVEHLIQHADQESITISEIRRSALRQWEKVNVQNPLVQAQWVLNSMYALEVREGSRGWVIRADDGSEEHRGKAKWYINPHLVTIFADYRKAVVRAKAQQLRTIGKVNEDNPIHAIRRPHGADELED